MKKAVLSRIILCAAFAVLLTSFLLACTPRNDAGIVGTWQLVSYTTDDGLSASGEDFDVKLLMIFRENGMGEAKADDQLQYVFSYTAHRGELRREITRTTSNVQQVLERYTLDEGGKRLTVYSSEEQATIVLQKVTE